MVVSERNVSPPIHHQRPHDSHHDIDPAGAWLAAGSAPLALIPEYETQAWGGRGPLADEDCFPGESDRQRRLYEYAYPMEETNS